MANCTYIIIIDDNIKTGSSDKKVIDEKYKAYCEDYKKNGQGRWTKRPSLWKLIKEPK